MKDQEKQPDLLRWEPGMELSTEEEHEAAIAWLAAELLRENTPEQLAIIAARQMIFAAPRKALTYGEPRGLCAITDGRRRLKAVTDEALVKEAAVKRVGVVMSAVSNHTLSRASKTASDARHEKGRARKAKALEAWKASGCTNKTTYAANNCKNYHVTKEVMYKWLVKCKGTNT